MGPTMDDYYDYSPLIVLERPVVVTGPLTEFSRAVGYRATSLLGIPYHDIERLIEHEIGNNLSRLIALQGEEGYRQVEAVCLRRVLQQTPFGLVALGDGGLLSPTNRALVRQQARLVVLDFDLANIYWRAQRLSQQGETEGWHPLYRTAPSSVDDLRPFYLERQSGFSAADLSIDANRLEPPAACTTLMEWLQA